MKNEKAFTLIELVSVLVILAILALIVTPLVLNIIKKARTAADKRSIDAYGRSIELAIADYLLDNGTFPTSIEQLTIEYTGDEVVCNTTTLNEDSSVYLAECTVGGRAVLGYTYGKEQTVTYDAYEIGDEVTYNNVNYYVIKNSDETNSSVTLLKAEPLTVAEVNEYGVGHINKYGMYSHGTAYNDNSYGSMAYYSSETCGYVNSKWVDDDCITDYIQSDIKYVVDAWKTAKAPAASEARLITYEELTENLGFEYQYKNSTDFGYMKSSTTPSWVYNDNYSYWTMSPNNDSSHAVWSVTIDGRLSSGGVNYDRAGAVRPVITLNKSVI